MEILAPCGSPDHIRAAVFAGADAVYLGGRAFSARRGARNFSGDELREAIRFCHGYGVKVYLTFNTLLRDSEWDEAERALEDITAAGPDALIVQDFGLARQLRQRLPSLPLHASTQTSVHTPQGAAFCEQLGFERIVLARECARDAIREIAAATPLGIEVFVHGALCVSVSGQCGLSAMLGGRSGNRGLCAQPCRLDFRAGRQSYALSLKDLSLIELLPELEALGVTALKIEGRMKRPEYAAAAVTALRAGLRGETPDMEGLRAAFSREGFTQGYFTGRHENMTGVRSQEDISCTAAALPKLRALYRSPARRVPCRMTLSVQEHLPIKLELSDGTDTVSAVGSPPEPVMTRPSRPDEVKKWLSRLGGTPFEAAVMTLDMEDGLTVSSAAVSELRRIASEKLIAARIKRLENHYDCLPPPQAVPFSRQHYGKPDIRVFCRTRAQAEAVSAQANRLILPVELAEVWLETHPGANVIVSPGRFHTDEAAVTERLRHLRSAGAGGLLCENAAHLQIGRALGYPLHGGAGLNTFNSRTAALWEDMGLTDFIPAMELHAGAIRALNTALPFGLTVYGRQPLMLLRRCPFGDGCKTCDKRLVDRMGKQFPLRCRGSYRELLNADILWLADRLDDLPGAAFHVYLFHEESPEEAVAVLDAYRLKLPRDGAFTRGLYFRAVE